MQSRSTCRVAFAVALSLSFVDRVPAQVPPNTAVVATSVAAQPATLLLAVDLATMAVTPLSGFANDQFAPLALRIDPINRDILLAVDLGGGTSRVLRLGLGGSTITRVRQLADVTGVITDIVVPYPGDLALTIDGPQGGIVRVDRSGGAPVPALTAPFAVGAGSLSVYSAELWIAQSGVGAVPGQLRYWHSGSGNTGGTYPLPSIQPPTLTGIAELLTSIPTHVISTASGEVWQNILQQSLVQLPISPPLPPGGTESVRVAGGNNGYVLGNSAYPFLQRFDAYSTAAQSWVVVAGPLPGSPKSFDISAPASAQVHSFGERCSPSATVPWIGLQGGYPQLGNGSFTLTTTGIPGAAAIVTIGFSDQSAFGSPLPFALPGGGCELLVSPDAAVLHINGVNGRSTQALPIPSSQSFAGVVLFGQWIHLIGGPLIAATDALALHVF